MFVTGCVRRSTTAVVSSLLLATAAAQEPAAAGWLEPPPVIKKLVLASPPPSSSLSPQGSWLVLTTREALAGVDVVARPHLKLAGMRIDPATWGRQLGTKVTAIELRSLPDGRTHRVDVEPGHWSGPIWAADERAYALIRNVDGGGELWLADKPTAKPRRIDGVRLNQVLGQAVQWLPDQRRLLVKLIVPGGAPKVSRVPPGPQVQATTRGQRAQVRTYQDLLQNQNDEALLEYYGNSQLAIVDGGSGAVESIGDAAMFVRVDASPDGTQLLVRTVHRPFSYLLPIYRFPQQTAVLGIDGSLQRELDQHGLLDAIPIGGVAKGVRQVQWVPTTEHALCWVEAQDGGDPKSDVPFRDFVFLLPSVNQQPQLWFKTEHRSSRLRFGGDGSLVVASEYDRKTRNERVWRHQLGKLDAGTLLYERSTQDVYSDPGRPIGERLLDGRSVMRMRDGKLFLTGSGASPSGNRPFVDAWAVDDGSKERLFEASDGRYETFVGFLDPSCSEMLVRSEARDDPPSLVRIDIASGEREMLLQFDDPAADWKRSVSKKLIRYEREDGVPMSGTLYLPPTYEEGQQLPCVLWAYPREYTKASDAGQVRATPNRYLRVRGTSHLFLLLHGYAVLDNASMPIVGPRRTANDSFVEQVRMNARAAIKALAAEGTIDTKRVAVAGHSYGAFMTANLLAHSDLFACGIARSGAYNRSLTPFGFQNEERTYWEAPQIYHAMSPFSHANDINEPILLLHGDDDNNSGTFPMQSRRLFAAIKGHGGVARLCMLPYESHGYRGRENVLHCLAEMCDWLDVHCKSAGD